MPPIAILWVPTFELVCSSSSGLTFTGVDMWGGAGWGNCVGRCVGGVGGSCVVWRSCVRGTVWGAMWVSGWDCVEELCGWVGGAVQGSCGWGHAHQSPDGPAIHTQLPQGTPSTRGIPHYPLSHPPLPSVPAHSSSQVVHCRVCPPHPLHAPVLVLHLAVYPASPTQGRVGSLTGSHTVHRHSATRPDEVSEIASEARQ